MPKTQERIEFLRNLSKWAEEQSTLARDGEFPTLASLLDMVFAEAAWLEISLSDPTTPEEHLAQGNPLLRDLSAFRPASSVRPGRDR